MADTSECDSPPFANQKTGPKRSVRIRNSRAAFPFAWGWAADVPCPHGPRVPLPPAERPGRGAGRSPGAVGAAAAAVRAVHGPAALLPRHGAGGQLDEQAGGIRLLSRLSAVQTAGLIRAGSYQHCSRESGEEGSVSGSRRLCRPSSRRWDWRPPGRALGLEMSALVWDCFFLKSTFGWFWSGT